MAETPDVPHLAFPLRLTEDGSFATVEQDTIDDVRQCVHVLLRTPLGARPLAPGVGVEDPTFTDVDAAALTTTLEAQEDRAAVTVYVAPVDEFGEQTLEVFVALAGDRQEDPTT